MPRKKVRGGQFVKGGQEGERHLGKSTEAGSSNLAEPEDVGSEISASLGSHPQQHQQHEEQSASISLKEKIENLENECATLHVRLADEKVIWSLGLPSPPHIIIVYMFYSLI